MIAAACSRSRATARRAPGWTRSGRGCDWSSRANGACSPRSCRAAPSPSETRFAPWSGWPPPSRPEAPARRERLRRLNRLQAEGLDHAPDLSVGHLVGLRSRVAHVRRLEHAAEPQDLLREVVGQPQSLAQQLQQRNVAVELRRCLLLRKSRSIGFPSSRMLVSASIRTASGSAATSIGSVARWWR